MQEVNLPNQIFGYYNTTSNHLPVSARFQFQALDAPEFETAAWAVYPNPVRNELNITFTGILGDRQAAVYDLTGRQVLAGELKGESINVSMLPAGIYILKLDGRSQKFVKE